MARLGPRTREPPPMVSQLQWHEPSEVSADLKSRRPPKVYVCFYRFLALVKDSSIRSAVVQPNSAWLCCGMATAPTSGVIVVVQIPIRNLKGVFNI